MTLLSVVIPAYNEENGIAEIVNRVLSIKKDLPGVGVDGLEVLVVDDGSKDKTAVIAGELAHTSEEVRVIQHKRNRGYGGALKTGFAQAKGELVGFLDADGTYPPEYFPALCQEALKGSELVIGSRMAGADSKMPMTRRVGNIFFATLLSIVGRQKVSDSASGMRVFKKEILEQIYPLPDGLNLTPVMSTRAIHEGIKMAEIPIPYSERVGRSKLSIFRDGRIFLQSMLWTVLTYNPVRILGLIGLAGVGVAFLVGLGLILARMSGITSLGPWGVAAVYWALISAVGGISFFALGATFNYLVSLFYKKPIRQGLFGKPIFNPSIDHHFGWAGLLSFFLGILIALISFVLGLSGWSIERLWLYLLGSAMMMLVGIQLVIYWILLRVLDELSQREDLVEKDMIAG
jgi:glycosyltransferase involved in cell wall biosynthesis